LGLKQANVQRKPTLSILCKKAGRHRIGSQDRTKLVPLKRKHLGRKKLRASKTSKKSPAKKNLPKGATMKDSEKASTTYIRSKHLKGGGGRPGRPLRKYSIWRKDSN